MRSSGSVIFRKIQGALEDVLKETKAEYAATILTDIVNASIMNSVIHTSTLALTHPLNMTVVSNDPGWFPTISVISFFSYWMVAASVVVVYDWVLTIGQEIELIWGQHWSLMTVLYLVIRYIGLPYTMYRTASMPMVSLTDAVSSIVYLTVNGTSVAVTAMLGVIMIARLHAMYHSSRMMLIFLVITFLAVNIACGVITIIGLKGTVAVELILFGIHMCRDAFEGDAEPLAIAIWTLNTVWEILALCLSVWIAVKHFLDLRRFNASGRSAMGDCFKVLVKSHVLYFASFAGVSCMQLLLLSPELVNSISMRADTLYGACQILYRVQLFVLGPRLILSIRDYHAKLVANSDAETNMDSIVFQERVHVPTSSTV
ncbi:hypothetical protein BDR07DRAFT_1389394 [Suillus spraguei]|nr:hypothetical protein BDR07DRAFT_1389394 [Suillus spraguei]